MPRVGSQWKPVSWEPKLEQKIVPAQSNCLLSLCQALTAVFSLAAGGLSSVCGESCTWDSCE